jgi:hypothetical protein
MVYIHPETDLLALMRNVFAWGAFILAFVNGPRARELREGFGVLRNAGQQRWIDEEVNLEEIPLG